ncbi:hypothetical protein CJF30_00010459 [Rutstroemia sp. NJR-2017a BBW]|nr:hypothetical protein CJF30_00010459 [Rutstroemia sp. NJR-2017a BBW]
MNIVTSILSLLPFYEPGFAFAWNTIDHPLVDFKTDSVVYLKTVFVACYFFDVGLYFPKASLIAFYWWLVPHGLRRLRIGVYVSMVFMLASFIATVLTDTLLAPKISDNWYGAIKLVF